MNEEPKNTDQPEIDGTDISELRSDPQFDRNIDAMRYMMKKSYAAGNSSSLKKAQRMIRIQSGKRPVKVLDAFNKKLMDGGSKKILHPTKGWRNA